MVFLPTGYVACSSRYIMEADVVLHNLLRQKHPFLQANKVDHKDEKYNVIPDARR